MNERRGIIHRLGVFWQWSAKYPNGRLAAVGLAVPLATLPLLIGIEATYMALYGQTFSEAVWAWLLLTFIMLNFAAVFVILPFACWRAIRDGSRNQPHPDAP